MLIFALFFSTCIYYTVALGNGCHSIRNYFFSNWCLRDTFKFTITWCLSWTTKLWVRLKVLFIIYVCKLHLLLEKLLRLIGRKWEVFNEIKLNLEI